MSFPTIDKVHQVLDPSGEVVGELPDLSQEQLLSFYRWMVFGRVFSERMVALQRQGRTGTFAPIDGQEAVSVGIAAPLQAEDWLLGSYRETLCGMVKGVPMLAIMEWYGGRIPTSYSPEIRCLPFQIVLASQILHTLGLAMAMKYNNEPHVAVGVCGDGATSEGDFNEALNMAGVYKAPMVFVVQNNGWAISVPRDQQTAAEYIAQRGPGFGMPGYVVDGNDVLAVYQIVSECVARARSGEGPSLVEALTYRLGAHTTADDPKKYRPEAELELWRSRDPIMRFHHFLLNQGCLTSAEDERIRAEAKQQVQEVVETYEALPPSDPAQHFDLVYAEAPPQLLRQRADLLRSVGKEL